MTRVKVCCIASVEEARLAVCAGASALGLVSEMPSGPGVISEARIAAIAATVSAATDTFLLTSRTDAGEIAAQQRRCGVNTVQICDGVSPRVYEELRRSLPGISLVQVIHVTGEPSLTEARRLAPEVDALLLDTGDRSLPTPELGGTGRTHDWHVSARIVENSPVPVFLAGGLNPENVGEAICLVRPFGVDLCTGVRSAGRLDERKLQEFMAAVAAAS